MGTGEKPSDLLPGSGVASLSMQAMHCITTCNLACIVPGKVVNYMGSCLKLIAGCCTVETNAFLLLLLQAKFLA